MSQSTITIDQSDRGREVRRDRPARPDRAANYEEKPPTTIIERGDDLDPAAVVADSARQLQDKDRQVVQERNARIRAEQEAANSRREAVTARATQLTDRQAIVAQALEGAKSEQLAARASLRSARESGDLDQEMAASELLSAATFRLTQASTELDALKRVQPQATAGDQRQQQTQQDASAPSPEAQDWLDKHPRYKVDLVYRGAANEAHLEAIRLGLDEGGRDYIDHIENTMVANFGDDHGRVRAPNNGGNRDVDQGGRRSPGAQDGLSPGRRSSGNANGFSPVKTVLLKDAIQVKRENGALRVRMSREQEDQMREGAETCHMSLEDYIEDQIAIASERSEGGTGDLIDITGGNRYE